MIAVMSFMVVIPGCLGGSARIIQKTVADRHAFARGFAQAQRSSQVARSDCS
jgi:hypothetical protein